MSAEHAIAANWYADPSDPAQLRWWDGVAWTEHVAPAQPQAPVAEAAPLVEAAPVAAPVAAPAVEQAPALPKSKKSKLSSKAPGLSGMSLGSGSVSPRLLVGIAALVLVAAGAFFFTHRAPTTDPAADIAPTTITDSAQPGAADPAATGAPAAPAATPADAPGSSVPKAVDAANGNGVSKATSTAADMQKNLDATTAPAVPAG